MEQGKNIGVKLLDFFIYSNLLISIACFLFTLQTALAFHASETAAAFFGITNFIATFSLYSLQRIYQSTKPYTDHRLAWYHRNKKILFTLILVFISLYYSIFINNYVVFKYGLLMYLPAAAFSVIYFLPPFALRRMPVSKIFLIGGVWAYTSVFIPLLYNEGVFSFSNIGFGETSYIVAQLLFIAAICVPFDIRDMENDRQNSIKTLPVQFGLGKSKTIGIILLLTYVFLAQNTIQFTVFGITGLLGILLIYFSFEHKHRYFFSVLVDGLIIFQFVLYSLFTRN